MIFGKQPTALICASFCVKINVTLELEWTKIEDKSCKLFWLSCTKTQKKKNLTFIKLKRTDEKNEDQTIFKQRKKKSPRWEFFIKKIKIKQNSKRHSRENKIFHIFLHFNNTAKLCPWTETHTHWLAWLYLVGQFIDVAYLLTFLLNDGSC